MIPEQNFYYLCAGEIGIVLVGLFNILAAAIIQILFLLILFHTIISHHPANPSGLFIAIFASGTIFIAVFLSLFHQVFLTLLMTAGFCLLALFAVRILENRLQRSYSGAS